MEPRDFHSQIATVILLSNTIIKHGIKNKIKFIKILNTKKLNKIIHQDLTLGIYQILYVI